MWSCGAAVASAGENAEVVFERDECQTIGNIFNVDSEQQAVVFVNICGICGKALGSRGSDPACVF